MGSLVVADSSASVHSPGSATSPGPGGGRSTARSINPSVWTTLLVPATAVAASAGAAVSASDNTVVDASNPSPPLSPPPSPSPSATAMANAEA